MKRCASSRKRPGSRATACKRAMLSCSIAMSPRLAFCAASAAKGFLFSTSPRIGPQIEIGAILVPSSTRFLVEKSEPVWLELAASAAPELGLAALADCADAFAHVVGTAGDPLIARLKVEQVAEGQIRRRVDRLFREAVG